MIKLEGQLVLGDNNVDITSVSIINAPFSIYYPYANSEYELKVIYNTSSELDLPHLEVDTARRAFLGINTSDIQFRDSEAVCLCTHLWDSGILRNTPIFKVVGNKPISTIVINAKPFSFGARVLGEAIEYTNIEYTFSKTNRVVTHNQDIYYEYIYECNDDIFKNCVIEEVFVLNSSVGSEQDASPVELSSGNYIFYYTTEYDTSPQANLLLRFKLRPILQSSYITGINDVVNIENPSSTLYLSPKLNNVFSGERRAYSVKMLNNKDIINVDISNYTNMAFTKEEREDYSKPSYGLVSNIGNVQIEDRGELEKFYAIGFLKDGIAFNQYLVNTLERKKELIGEHIAKNFEYIGVSHKCSFNYGDNLEALQDIMVELKVDHLNTTPKTALQVLNDIKDQVEIFDFQYINGARDILNNTYIRMPYLSEAKTAWEAINKVCTLCQLHAYAGVENSAIIFSYNEGN